jgi:hypothetical protein
MVGVLVLRLFKCRRLLLIDALGNGA